jgi:hypothetical protein
MVTARPRRPKLAGPSLLFGRRLLPGTGLEALPDWPRYSELLRRHDHQHQISPPAIMANKPATEARKIMASAPAVIGLVRKFAGDQFADHVADRLIPLDGA